MTAASVAMYQPQMDAYRSALAILLGLDRQAIRTKLLFVSSGQVVEASAADT